MSKKLPKAKGLHASYIAKPPKCLTATSDKLPHRISS